MTPAPHIPAMLGNALQLHQAGRLAEAEALYRQVLSAEPRNATALQMLGVVHLQRGQHAEAVTLLRESLKFNDRDAQAHSNLGEALRHLGDANAAIESYRRALTLDPNLAEAHANLGLALAATKDLQGAENEFRTAMRCRANYAEAHQHLGNLLREQGRFREALASFETALRIKPDFTRALCRAGMTLKALGRSREAIAALQRTVVADPTLQEAYLELSELFRASLRDDLAVDALERLLRVAPANAVGCATLAELRARQGRLTESVALLRRAMSLPGITAFNNLGNALFDQGKVDEAIVTYRQGLRCHPENEFMHSNLLYTLHHDPAYDRARLFEEHKKWAAEHVDKVELFTSHSNSRDPDRRLRIGYVSADFRRTPVGMFTQPILRGHDREKFCIKCYSDVAVNDETTKQIKSLADEWQDTEPLSNDDFAQLVRTDEIDILIDLVVHAGRHRLLAFARRPAPLQMTYLGYPNTTGLPAIDYRITDVYMDPRGMAEAFHAEKLLRLESYFCYPAPENSPGIVDPPATRNGFITFGSFNRLGKISDPVIELWSKLLHALPDSRLMLQAQGLADEPTREYHLERFARHGVDVKRIETRGWAEWPNYFAAMNDVDVALDTFPFAGGTTSCHLLWMGVPLVTLAYDASVGRIGVSILNNIALPELIANDPQQYIAIASDLARDIPRLSELRRTMRERMRASSLMDVGRFMKHLESLYREAWMKWCEAKP